MWTQGGGVTREQERGLVVLLCVGLLVGGWLGWILAVIVAAILVTVVQRVLPGREPRTV